MNVIIIAPTYPFVKFIIHPKGEYSYPYQFPGPVLLVILQELLERHDPERLLPVDPLHRVVEPLPEEGLDPLFFALDPVDIDELVLKRALLELTELGDRIFSILWLGFSPGKVALPLPLSQSGRLAQPGQARA